MRSLIVATLIVGFGCGSVSEGGGNIDAAIDATLIDAPMTPDAGPNGANLGALCSNAEQCQAAGTCIPGIAEFASPTGNGYCSPNCGNGTATGDVTVCTNMYPGPVGGDPQCILGSGGNPEFCVIVCPSGNTNCPAGLICHTFDNGVTLCGPTDWTSP